MAAIPNKVSDGLNVLLQRSAGKKQTCFYKSTMRTYARLSTVALISTSRSTVFSIFMISISSGSCGFGSEVMVDSYTPGFTGNLCKSESRRLFRMSFAF